MSPKHKSSAAGNSDMTKKDSHLFPLNENLKVFGLEEENKSHIKVAKIYGKLFISYFA